MKKSGVAPCFHPLLLCALLLAVGTIQFARAYEDYSGCQTCRGNFRGPTSTKGTVFPNNNNHDMHRNAANMAPACNPSH